MANYLTQELYFYENEFTKNNFDYGSSFMNVVEGEKIKIEIKNKEPLKNELEAFVECVISDKEPQVTGTDGLDAIKIAQKFMESSKNNRVELL